MPVHAQKETNTYNALMHGQVLRKALLGNIVDRAAFACGLCGLLHPAKRHGDGCHTPGEQIVRKVRAEGQRREEKVDGKRTKEQDSSKRYMPGCRAFITA